MPQNNPLQNAHHDELTNVRELAAINATISRAFDQIVTSSSTAHVEMVRKLNEIRATQLELQNQILQAVMEIDPLQAAAQQMLYNRAANQTTSNLEQALHGGPDDS